MPAATSPPPSPSLATESSSSGTPTMAPTLAPMMARVIERPWCRSNHGATVVVMPVIESVDQPMPSATKHG